MKRDAAVRGCRSGHEGRLERGATPLVHGRNFREGRRRSGLRLAGAGTLLAVAAAALGAPSVRVDRTGAAGPHPPVTEIRYLSGHGTDDAVPWRFFCTSGRRSGAWSEIAVPSCWEQEGFGTYQYGLDARGKHGLPPASEKGRYRLRFTVPARWRGRTVRLVFEGSMTDTEAWLNGKPAGPAHQGAFYEFRYDVSKLLDFGGSNLLDVTVSKESSNRSVNAAERRGDYWNFGGIFRPVYLEALPSDHVDRVAIDARADGTLVADVFVGGDLPPGAVVEGTVSDQGGILAGGPFRATLNPQADAVPDAFKVAGVSSFAAGPAMPREFRIRMRATIRGPRLWTAETPNLYQLTVRLVAGGKVRHVVTRRFGFRTFAVRAHDGLYLNGVRILLKGCDRHSFWPETGRALSRARDFADARLIKEMNMNAVRMSHYPPDREFLDACDELGIYVLDELSGWHGKYDTPTGKTLVAEMVQRDVNHPSVLFWDNGNETGWNTALDGEFGKWDPQGRPVLHPQGLLSGVDTMHYRSYPETKKYLAKPDIFMPTEFLHGLFDGGSGAGLYDYWELMRKAPRCGGGFLWSFADEGLARTDEHGRIDNVGNYAPDGIVGPHHEPEGSFNAVREIWSPVVITGPATLGPGFDGRFRVENRYDFTPLDRCSFQWELASFVTPESTAAGHRMIANGTLRGPRVAPGNAGELEIPLPRSWRESDVLYVTARDPDGAAVWTWSWPVRREPARLVSRWPGSVQSPPGSRETEDELVATVGDLQVRFSRRTGELAGIVRDGRMLSLANGPRLIALRRGDRRPDGSVEPRVAKGVDRTYFDVSGASALRRLSARVAGADVVVDAEYTGGLRRAEWRISASGEIRLDYDYEYDSFVDLLGVEFDYPETSMLSIRRLGYGPYRVWANRMRGTTLDVWENLYNDPVPGVSFSYPEFKGFFRGWRWVDFGTTEGHLRIASEPPGRYLGVYSPRDGAGALLYDFPRMGISFLDVIPPVRNKVDATDLIGPESQPRRLAGAQHRTVRFLFDRH